MVEDSKSLEELIEQPPPPSAASQIPDGGLVAWLQCLSSFFLFFNCWGIVNTFGELSLASSSLPFAPLTNIAVGAFQTFYEENLLSDQTSSNISWVGSLQAFLLMFVGAISGPIFDAGYLRALLGAGTFLTVFGMMMTSICSAYWQVVLAQGITVGIGCGCLFVPSVAILPTYFSTKKSLALGIGASGSSLGERIGRDCGVAVLTITRWHYLSHSFPQTRAADWLLLDDASNGFHHAHHSGHPSRTHENTYQASCKTEAGRFCSLQRTPISTLLDRGVFCLYGAICSLLLRAALFYSEGNRG